MTPIDYGSAKSSGSISESSASSDSASSDSGSGSSTSGSGGVFDSSGSGSDASAGSSGTSDTSTGGSGGSSSGSTGDYCSWAIESITYSADNEMMFVIHNTGTIPIEFTAIWTAIDGDPPDAIIAPSVSPSTPGASFTVAAGASVTVAAVSNGDLRNVEFYIDSSCGFKFDTFPSA